ncbi:MAG TPA: NAD(P)-dependent oxidoreductase, partial [Gemmataceae bacterium]|nr:NAD(P)-dependent oxidoreductase [Gemmataceae bacterium]
TICPGHGPMAGNDLLETQKRYFVDLRKNVKQGIEAGKTGKEIADSMDLPWYKEWTGVPPTEPNIQYVYDEMTGRVAPWDLAEDYGIYEGPSPTKDSPGWKPPRKIVVPSGLMPARLEELKVIAPDVEFIPVKNAEEAAKIAEDADAVVGFCSPEIVKAGKKLRWIQVNHGGVEDDLSDELIRSPVVLTSTAPVDGPSAAEQAFALLFELMNRANQVSDGVQWAELKGKTVLVIGMGGAGVQVARRAESFGARVMAVDSRNLDRPSFVFSLDKMDRLMDLLPRADIVVLACQLTKETTGMMGPQQLDAMKPTAYVINVANGELVHTTALMHKLQNHAVGGVGLAISDTVRPVIDPTKAASNLAVMPRATGRSPEAAERRWELFRENIRRFTAGEPLLCVVDKAKGY